MWHIFALLRMRFKHPFSVPFISPAPRKKGKVMHLPGSGVAKDH
jgi:hypothetical protein